MRSRHLAPSLIALLMAALLAAGSTAPAWAAAQHSAAAATRMLPAATVNNEQTLPDTSIDDPALDTDGNTSVLAWTGTDAAHHVNTATFALQ